MKPTRIQRSRAKGAITPPGTKYCGFDVAHNRKGVYEVGELLFRQPIHLTKKNSSTKAGCLIVSLNFINTLLAVVAAIQGTNLKVC